MKTGVTVASRSVISLPAKLRKATTIQPEDQLIAETTPDGIMLRPAVTLPVEIYSAARVREFDAEGRKLAKVLEKKSRP